MGLKLDAAKNRILGSSLNLGANIYDNSIASGEDTLKAFVFKQNPEYKETSTLQLGSIIYLWLTVDSTKLPVDLTLVVTPDTLKTKVKNREAPNKDQMNRLILPNIIPICILSGNC